MADDTRFEEYRMIVEDTVKLSDRRQTLHDLFLGVNSLFFTAAGFATVSSNLTTWWTTAICGAVTLVALGINATWIQLIQRYRDLTGLRIRYLEGLEKSLQASGLSGTLDIMLPSGDKPQPFERGVYSFEAATIYAKGPKVGFFQLERRLAWIFIIAYLLLTVGVAVLTYLITNGFLSPLKLT